MDAGRQPRLGGRPGHCSAWRSTRRRWPADASARLDAAQSPVAPPTDRAAAGVRPLAVSIPSIGVRSSLIPLALLPGSGELAAPADFERAGWYAEGRPPATPARR